MFRTYAVAVIVLLLLAYGAYRLAVREPAPTVGQDQVAALAECLSSSGAKLYGAYWCSHCEQQKEAFGDAADRLPFVECGVEGDVSRQTDECAAAGITSYPTWRFADGTEKVGEADFDELAELSGCPWP